MTMLDVHRLRGVARTYQLSESEVNRICSLARSRAEDILSELTVSSGETNRALRDEMTEVNTVLFALGVDTVKPPTEPDLTITLDAVEQIALRGVISDAIARISTALPKMERLPEMHQDVPGARYTADALNSIRRKLRGES